MWAFGIRLGCPFYEYAVILLYFISIPDKVDCLAIDSLALVMCAQVASYVPLRSCLLLSEKALHIVTFAFFGLDVLGTTRCNVQACGRQSGFDAGRGRLELQQYLSLARNCRAQGHSFLLD